MLCEKCGKNHATTHIHSVVNGVVTEKNLCGYCAAKEGYNDFTHNSLAQMLSSMFGKASVADQNGNSHRCKCCNSSFMDIAESGKAGCPECYKTFYNDIFPYIKRVHGSTKHVGKIPNRAPLVVKNEEETIDSLRIKLNELVRKELFEEAACVRDKIKEMEGKAQ